MRFAFAALALLAAACSPPETPSGGATIPQSAETPPPAGPESDAALEGMVATLQAALTLDIGVPVEVTIATARQDGDWGWLVAQPQNVDWSRTKYASAVENGVFDGSGVTYALLQRENGVWILRAMTVGPTDVAYTNWPQEYGAPASLMGLE